MVPCYLAAFAQQARGANEPELTEEQLREHWRKLPVVPAAAAPPAPAAKPKAQRRALQRLQVGKRFQRPQGVEQQRLVRTRAGAAFPAAAAPSPAPAAHRRPRKRSAAAVGSSQPQPPAPADAPADAKPSAIMARYKAVQPLHQREHLEREEEEEEREQRGDPAEDDPLENYVATPSEARSPSPGTPAQWSLAELSSASSIRTGEAWPKFNRGQLVDTRHDRQRVQVIRSRPDDSGGYLVECRVLGAVRASVTYPEAALSLSDNYDGPPVSPSSEGTPDAAGEEDQAEGTPKRRRLEDETDDLEEEEEEEEEAAGDAEEEDSSLTDYHSSDDSDGYGNRRPPPAAVLAARKRVAARVAERRREK